MNCSLKTTKIGDLQTEKLDDLWNGEKLFKEFRKMQLSGNHSQNQPITARYER